MASHNLRILTSLLAFLAFTGCTGPTLPALTPATSAPAGEITAASQKPAAGAASAQLAERVVFAPGATSATHSGALPAGGEKQYALTAIAGQNLHVRTVGYAAPVHFTVNGPGVVAQPGAAEASDGNVFRAAVPLPSTGDYLVILSAPADAETAYDVTFTLDTSLSQEITPQPGPAQRIDFDPSSGSAQRSGLLRSGPGVEQFVLSLPPDQVLTVDVASDGAPLRVTIAAPSGNQWNPEALPTADGYNSSQQFTTPEGGYYVVTLVKGEQTPSTNYTITFALQP
jgi:hypothetical protein